MSVELFRVECDVPDGVHEVTVLLDTICNEAAELASGYLTFGNNLVGIINWGTCVMYPEGFRCDDIQTSLSSAAAGEMAVCDGAEEPGEQGRACHVPDRVAHRPGRFPSDRR